MDSFFSCAEHIRLLTRSFERFIHILLLFEGSLMASHAYFNWIYWAFGLMYYVCWALMPSKCGQFFFRVSWCFWGQSGFFSPFLQNWRKSKRSQSTNHKHLQHKRNINEIERAREHITTKTITQKSHTIWRRYKNEWHSLRDKRIQIAS